MAYWRTRQTSSRITFNIPDTAFSTSGYQSRMTARNAGYGKGSVGPHLENGWQTGRRPTFLTTPRDEISVQRQSIYNQAAHRSPLLPTPVTDVDYPQLSQYIRGGPLMSHPVALADRRLHNSSVRKTAYPQRPLPINIHLSEPQLPANRNVPHPRRLPTPTPANRSANPQYTVLLKAAFKYGLLQHHTRNWGKTPRNLMTRIFDLVDNIHPPLPMEETTEALLNAESLLENSSLRRSASTVGHSCKPSWRPSVRLKTETLIELSTRPAVNSASDLDTSLSRPLLILLYSNVMSVLN